MNRSQVKLKYKNIQSRNDKNTFLHAGSITTNNNYYKEIEDNNTVDADSIYTN